MAYKGGLCLTPEEIDHYISAFSMDDPEIRAMHAHVKSCARCKTRASDAETNDFGVDNEFDKYE